MMLLDYEELFRPYTDRNATLENSLRYLEKERQLKGITQEAMEAAIHEVFMEVAHGKLYPINYCPCGCGIDKPPTAITHAIRDRMLQIDKRARVEMRKIINRSLNDMILEHVARDNAEYTKAELPEEDKPNRWERIKKKFRRKK